MAVNQIDFTVSTPDEFATSLAQYLPNGDLFVAKNIPGSNFRNFLLALSQEGVRAEALIKAISDNHYIPITENFIDEWESAVGIPDSCFAGEFQLAATPEELLDFRRRDVITKLALMNIGTATQIINLAAIYGYEITISNYYPLVGFPVPFPWVFGGDGTEARFTMIVTFLNVAPPDNHHLFPVLFPWEFGNTSYNVVQCFINKMVPANVNVIYLYTG